MSENVEKKLGLSLPPGVRRAATGSWIISIANEEDARKIVEGFWKKYGDVSILQQLQDGRMDAIKTETITSAARTTLMKDDDGDYHFKVVINQNSSEVRGETSKAVEDMLADLGIEK